jgi:hypothetical protein
MLEKRFQHPLIVLFHVLLGVPAAPETAAVRRPKGRLCGRRAACPSLCPQIDTPARRPYIARTRKVWVTGWIKRRAKARPDRATGFGAGVVLLRAAPSGTPVLHHNHQA